MKPGFFKQLCEIAGKENVRTDEPMKQHTTFRIGGAADYFVSPQTTDQIKNIIELCKSEAMPWYVIGNGSNLLVSDRGFRGVIIQLFKNFSDLRVATRSCTSSTLTARLSCWHWSVTAAAIWVICSRLRRA